MLDRVQVALIVDRVQGDCRFSGSFRVSSASLRQRHRLIDLTPLAHQTMDLDARPSPKLSSDCRLFVNNILGTEWQRVAFDSKVRVDKFDADEVHSWD